MQSFLARFRQEMTTSYLAVCWQIGSKFNQILTADLQQSVFILSSEFIDKACWHAMTANCWQKPGAGAAKPARFLPLICWHNMGLSYFWWQFVDIVRLRTVWNLLLSAIKDWTRSHTQNLSLQAWLSEKIMSDKKLSKIHCAIFIIRKK